MNLKPICLLILFTVITSVSLKAQTNTFPSSGNVGIGTTSPGSALEINGDIEYSYTGVSDYIRRKLTGFVNDERSHFLLLYKSTDTSTRVVGRITGFRSTGSSNPSSINLFVESGRGTGGNHDVSVQYSSLSGGSSGYKVSVVTVDYSGDNYVALKIDPGSGSSIITAGYFEGTTNKASLEVFPGDSVSNIADYTPSQDRKRTAILSPLYVQGKVGVGTDSPDELLTVKGKIHSEEIIVDLSVPGPDYVFEEDYDLPDLKELEAFIKSNKHLPEVPTAKEMEEDGIELGEMNMLLLKKIEELTLYTIKQNKIIEDQQTKIEQRLEREEQILKQLYELNKKINQMVKEN